MVPLKSDSIRRVTGVALYDWVQWPHKEKEQPCRQKNTHTPLLGHCAEGHQRAQATLFGPWTFRMASSNKLLIFIRSSASGILLQSGGYQPGSELQDAYSEVKKTEPIHEVVYHCPFLLSLGRGFQKGLPLNSTVCKRISLFEDGLLRFRLCKRKRSFLS